MVDQFNMAEVLAKQQAAPPPQPPAATESQPPDLMGIVANALIKNPGKARDLLGDLDDIDPSLRPLVIELVKSKYPTFAPLIDQLAGDSNTETDIENGSGDGLAAPDDEDWDEALTYASKQRRKGMTYGDICERVRWKYGIDWQPAKLKRLLMWQDESTENPDAEPQDDVRAVAVQTERMTRHAERLRKLAEENKKMKEAVALQSFRFFVGCGVVGGALLGFVAGRLI